MIDTATHCKCGGDSTVIDTRASEFIQRRRRKCVVCGLRWTTSEERVDNARPGVRTGHATQRMRRDLLAELEVHFEAIRRVIEGEA